MKHERGYYIKLWRKALVKAGYDLPPAKGTAGYVKVKAIYDALRKAGSVEHKKAPKRKKSSSSHKKECPPGCSSKCAKKSSSPIAHRTRARK